MNQSLAIAAACVALSAPAFAAKGDPEAGKVKAQPCQACHGESGTSAAPDFPKIGGQHADYIAAVLRHYKLGKRKNPIMAGQVANLSEKDVLDLAAWFATQSGLAIKY